MRAEAGPPAGPLPDNIAERIPMSHAAPKTMRLRDLATKPLPKLVAWSVEEWRGLHNAPSVHACLLEVTAAHNLIFRRDLNELHRIRSPPPSVELVLEAVAILLGYTPRVTYPAANEHDRSFRPGGGGETAAEADQRLVANHPGCNQDDEDTRSGGGPRKKVDYSDATKALLRDPLRLRAEIGRPHTHNLLLLVIWAYSDRLRCAYRERDASEGHGRESPGVKEPAPAGYPWD